MVIGAKRPSSHALVNALTCRLSEHLPLSLGPIVTQDYFRFHLGFLFNRLLYALVLWVLVYNLGQYRPFVFPLGAFVGDLRNEGVVHIVKVEHAMLLHICEDLMDVVVSLFKEELCLFAIFNENQLSGIFKGGLILFLLIVFGLPFRDFAPLKRRIS